MHRESTNQLRQLENIDIFIAATQAVKEMRRYLKMDEVEVGTIQIEDLKETVVNAFEDIREDNDETA
jgi:hypothetical protein